MEISEIDAPSTEPVMGSPRGDDDPADAAECATADQGAIESDAEKVHIDAHSDLFGRQSPEFLKERGNDAYKNGDFIGACELYTSAIMRLEYSNDDVLKSQLYANRAACHIAVEQYDLAVNDTTDAILMNGSYVKVSTHTLYDVINTKCASG
ncbi:hypothetical protein X943_004041 [Babesia divergens]|uniref:Uncharacterized protein n=1 Tax=Babesia divergens TaxID=32595 RepID=A0AAD9GDR4_BABDI|nr:hypothetical protein X943_004041 [Babesia divergens]